jgi:hypothetical protein
MLNRMLILWILYAGIAGFALGGTFVSSFLFPDAQVHADSTKAEEQSADSHSKEKTEQALARYTLWLTAFTGILAFATIGLGIATVGLYLTGEKQIGVAQQALTDLERPYLFIVNYNWLLIEKADEHGWKYGVGYAVSNGGKLPAFIRSVEVGLGFGPNIPPLEDQPPINELLTAPLLASGENRVLAQGMADFGGSPRECQIRGGLHLHVQHISSQRSFALASRTVCQTKLLTASGPPHSSGHQWSLIQPGQEPCVSPVDGHGCSR